MGEEINNTLSRLLITKDYHFILLNYNRREVELQSVHKAVYLLFHQQSHPQSHPQTRQRLVTRLVRAPEGGHPAPRTRRLGVDFRKPCERLVIPKKTCIFASGTE